MSKKKEKLNNLLVGQKGKIIGLLSKGNQRRRMLDLGIIEGTKIKVLLKSHSGDPIAYFIRGAVIALRNEDASKVLVQEI